MIYFSELGQYGRLGNQLFQYAAAKCLAVHHKTEVGLEDLDNKFWHGQYCLLTKFNLNYLKIDKTPNVPRYQENPNENWKFNPNFFNLPEEVNLYGFFQHAKYFESIQEIIFKEFEIKDIELEQKCVKFLSNFKNPVSIHLRLGDLMDQFRQHGYEEYLKNYIHNAYKNFDSNSDFLVFSGGNRNADDSTYYFWARENIKGSNFHYIEGNDPVTDLCLIKNCKGNILGIDSTFSWWASYLNKEGKVVAPKKMPYSLMETTVKNWILI